MEYQEFFQPVTELLVRNFVTAINSKISYFQDFFSECQEIFDRKFHDSNPIILWHNGFFGLSRNFQSKISWQQFKKIHDIMKFFRSVMKLLIWNFVTTTKNFVTLRNFLGLSRNSLSKISWEQLENFVTSRNF